MNTIDNSRSSYYFSARHDMVQFVPPGLEHLKDPWNIRKPDYIESILDRDFI